MYSDNPNWAAHQRQRWLRPDAERYERPDAARWLKPALSYAIGPVTARKYSPDQPRVPAGNPDGGQWTDAEGGEAATTELSAQSRRRGGRIINVNGERLTATPAQAARLAVAEARAQDAVRRVQEIDPTWRPTASLYETVEAKIAALEAEASEAQARASELARMGIGPGPFAGESIPARSKGRNFSTFERREINRIGSQSGCHTCGTFEPGTTYGDFVIDHQLPTAINGLRRSQRLYPQCLTCSKRQGGFVGRRGQK